MKNIHVQEDNAPFTGLHIGNLLYTAWHIALETEPPYQMFDPGGFVTVRRHHV